MRSAPPRGMSRSTRPRAVISARTAPWPPSRRPTASAGRPWALERGAQHGDGGAVGVGGRAAAAQDDGVAGLQAQAGGVDGDVGPGLVDHADDAHGDAHLADLQAVGERGAAHDLADGVGQGGDVAQGLGDGGDARGVEAQAVLEAVRHPVLAAAGEVALVGRRRSSSVAASRASARVRSAASFSARESRARRREAVRAASASSRTRATSAGSMPEVRSAMPPRVCRSAARGAVPSAGRGCVSAGSRRRRAASECSRGAARGVLTGRRTR